MMPFQSCISRGEKFIPSMVGARAIKLCDIAPNGQTFKTINSSLTLFQIYRIGRQVPMHMKSIRR